jgi:DNA polymerase-1
VLQKTTITLPPIVYCTTYAEAVAGFAEVIQAAKGRPIGLDIETASKPAEAARLEALLAQQAVLKGKAKAAKKCNASVTELAELKAEAKLLATQVRYAQSAALDPHRGRIRLVQLYAGGDRVVVIDVFKAGARALELLSGVDAVAHNLAFETSYLEEAGVELGECHCTLQAVRLTLGERSTSLADAVEAYFGVVLDKTEQVSDWSAPDLTAAQLEYAALDAVMAFKLMGKVFPALGPQTSAYEIQIAAVPAVARMGRRGVWLDSNAHVEFMHAQLTKRAEAHAAYQAACRDAGLVGLATKVPATPDEKREVLNAILTSDEIARWARTKKSGALSTARNELKRANHYPPIKALVELSKIDKILTAFGLTLSVFVSPVTGRIHANYRVAATAAGRATCSYPNIQQAPRDPAFRALFKPKSGYKYVGADFASMELRAAAYVSDERAMIEAFRDGLDLHRLTASRMLSKAPEDVTDEERRAAKSVNFGAIYGSGAGRLVQTAWDQYDTVLTIDEAVRSRLSSTPIVGSPTGATITTSFARKAAASSSARTPSAVLGASSRCRACRQARACSRDAAICRSRARAPTLRCWRSLRSIRPCSTSASTAVPFCGCTTRSFLRCRPRRPRGRSFCLRKPCATLSPRRFPAPSSWACSTDWSKAASATIGQRLRDEGWTRGLARSRGCPHAPRYSVG